MILPSGLSQRSVILSLVLKDLQALYASYMSFVKYGGLFVPTQKTYQLGDEVFLLVSLLAEPEKIPVSGKVVWVTPQGGHGNQVAGIGVQLTEHDKLLCERIETYLAGRLNADKPTHTL